MSSLMIQPPISGITDILLADVAIKIQLPPHLRETAAERYATIAHWIDRDGSPLQGRVELLYPQGSMAIGTAIASKLKNDEFDLDIVAQLSLPTTLSPTETLDTLFLSIRGDKGSRYYNMADRNSRCVTVSYSEMHLDITPAILQPTREPKTSIIFHSKKSDNLIEIEYYLTANPFGFAEWFLESMPPDIEFSKEYASRSQAHYLAEAPSNPIPDMHPSLMRSKRIVAFQLFKRWRNKVFDTRKVRMPPSVVLARIIASLSGTSSSLSEELKAQAQLILNTLELAHSRGKVIHLVNPRCNEDILTDRWPESISDQAMFMEDLRRLLAQLAELETAQLQRKQEIMIDIFGERPTIQVFEEFSNKMQEVDQQGGLRFSPVYGGIAASSSGLSEPAFSAPNTRQEGIKAPTNTFFGDD